jgi:hypothetical protein
MVLLATQRSDPEALSISAPSLSLIIIVFFGDLLLDRFVEWLCHADDHFDKVPREAASQLTLLGCLESAELANVLETAHV